MTIFVNWTFKEIITVMCGHMGRPSSNMSSVLIRRWNLDTGTEERPCEDTRRWLSPTQGERSQKKPNLPTLRPQTSSLQACKKINSYLQHLVCGALYGSPRKPIPGSMSTPQRWLWSRWSLNQAFKNSALIINWMIGWTATGNRGTVASSEYTPGRGGSGRGEGVPTAHST
jgi:hypothetical protein